MSYLMDFISAEKEILLPKGYNLWTCFTQAYHETAAFKSVIGKNNYWGIKKPAKWEGKEHVLFTTENELILEGETQDQAEIRLTVKYGVRAAIAGTSGRFWTIRLPQVFIDFDTATQAIEYWDGLINRLYAGALEYSKNPPMFFQKLVDGPNKWATDPRYAQKLSDLYTQLRNNTILADMVEINQKHGNTYEKR